jgi:hypothetical protein
LLRLRRDRTARPVSIKTPSRRIRKSVGAENTFASDLTEFDAMVELRGGDPPTGIVRQHR